MASRRYWALASVAFLVWAAPTVPSARADFVFQLAGSFGADSIGTSGLAGGSFFGTFSVTSLPFPEDQTLHPVTSFHVVFRDSTNADVATLDSSNAALFSGIYTGYDPGSGHPVVDILNLSDASNGYGLQLDFLAPFNGTGPVISQNSIYQDLGSYGSSPDGTADVASGTSTLAVPEPSSLILFALGALPLLAACAGGRRLRASGFSFGTRAYRRWTTN